MSGAYLIEIGLPASITLEDEVIKTDQRLLNPFIAAAPRRRSLNSIVSDVSSSTPPQSPSSDDVRKLLAYSVPVQKDGDASCGRTITLDEKAFDLSMYLYGVPFSQQKGDFIPRICRLRDVVVKLQNLTGVDWLGVYEAYSSLPSAPEKQVVPFLLKEAYVGEPSRAIFPLTKEFAASSNNSTVGLSGTAVLIQDVASHSGPYYMCSQKVKSEFCVPIFDSKRRTIGIVDAESWTKDYFTNDRIAQIVKVCEDLGKNALFRSST